MSTWPPARRYSWPPFEKDNTVALVNGLHSPRIYGPEAEVARQELLGAIEAEEATFLLERPTFRFALEALVTTIGRVRVGRRHLIEAHDSGECVRDSCPNQVAILERELDRRLDAMGLTARSRIAIQAGLSTAAKNTVDIATQIEEGRRIREQREQGENTNT